MKFLLPVCWAPVVLGAALVFNVPAFAQSLSAEREIGINKAVAIYEYVRGNHAQAIIELASDGATMQLDSQAHSRKLLRMEQIQKTLERSIAGEMPQALHNTIWLEISELHNAEGNCRGALDALEEVNNVSQERDHEVRVLRVNCMFEGQNLSPGIIAAAENIALAAEGESINLAYLYHNIGAAAQYLEDFDNAQRYFIKAMTYLKNTDEGIALESRIRLSLAWSYYESLGYNASLREFSSLYIDNEWVDLSLLGYGWAAFKSGDPGLAIESWRQLIYLPFKSISVYEGYLAIPFALESKNAYTEALRAYTRAAELYAEQIQKIEELSENITADQIEKHAVDYARSKGEPITPLHPLLVDAFSRGDFQDVFEVIAEIDRYQTIINGFQQTISALDEARLFNISTQASSQANLQNSERQVEQKLARLLTNLQQLGGKILAVGMSAKHVTPELKAKYKRYLSLQKKVDRAGKQNDASMQASLQRVRNILLVELEEQAKERGDRSYINNVEIIRLAESYRLLEQRYQAYWAMKPYAKKTNVGERELQLMQGRVDAAKTHIVRLQGKIDGLLILKTREALEEQREQLVVFENRARIALARLSEEFYQRGGRKLWN